MKSSVKTTLAELFAAVVLVVAVAVILSMGLSSCASTEKTVETAQPVETEKKLEAKKKTEYSKTDFSNQFSPPAYKLRIFYGSFHTCLSGVHISCIFHTLQTDTVYAAA